MRASMLGAVEEASLSSSRFRWLGYLRTERPEWPREDEGSKDEVNVGVGVCERCGVLLHWNSRRYHTGCKGRTWRA